MSETMSGAMPHDQHTADVQDHVMQSGFGLTGRVMNHPGVRAAANRALAAGVPWGQILAAILPLVMSLFSGGTINFQAIIDAILALIPKKP